MTRERVKSAERTSFETAGDHGNAGGTAQPACGFRGTLPSTTDYAGPEFIWKMSDKDRFRTLPESVNQPQYGVTTRR
mgnify:CR=1 FL=1